MVATHVDKQAEQKLDEEHKKFSNSRLLFRHERKANDPDISEADLKSAWESLPESEKEVLKEKAAAGRERFHAKKGPA